MKKKLLMIVGLIGCGMFICVVLVLGGLALLSGTFGQLIVR